MWWWFFNSKSKLRFLPGCLNAETAALGKDPAITRLGVKAAGAGRTLIHASLLGCPFQALSVPLANVFTLASVVVLENKKTTSWHVPYFKSKWLQPARCPNSCSIFEHYLLCVSFLSCGVYTECRFSGVIWGIITISHSLGKKNPHFSREDLKTKTKPARWNSYRLTGLNFADLWP